MKQLRITVAGQTFDVTVETVGGSAPTAAPAPVAPALVAVVARPDEELPPLLQPRPPVPEPPSPARWQERW